MVVDPSWRTGEQCYSLSGERGRLRAGNEVDELTQVLDGGGEVEFITSAGRTGNRRRRKLRLGLG
jgi:hypothetical protein